MKTIRSKSAGECFILEPGEECPPSGICFMQSEWDYIQKLTLDLKHDTESLKSFWETLLEKKKELPGYTIFQDYPREPIDILAPPKERLTAKQKLAIETCENIKAMLLHGLKLGLIPLIFYSCGSKLTVCRTVYELENGIECTGKIQDFLRTSYFNCTDGFEYINPPKVKQKEICEKK